MVYQYRYKFYLNASHSVRFNNTNGQIHSHCFEFIVAMGSLNKDNFTMFKSIEDSLEKVLAPYQNRLLNEVEPFDSINPTVENITRYFNDEFRGLLYHMGWLLLNLEISETPGRSYVINSVEDLLEEELVEEFYALNNKAANSVNAAIVKDLYVTGLESENISAEKTEPSNAESSKAEPLKSVNQDSIKPQVVVKGPLNVKTPVIVKKPNQVSTKVPVKLDKPVKTPVAAKSAGTVKTPVAAKPAGTVKTKVAAKSAGAVKTPVSLKMPNGQVIMSDDFKKKIVSQAQDTGDIIDFRPKNMNEFDFNSDDDSDFDFIK